MKKHHVIIALFIASFAHSVFADENNLGTCVYPAGLNKSINMTAYHQCVSKINQCPKNGPYLDGTCVKKQVEQDASCQELSQLAQHLNVSADLIYLQQEARFTVIDAVFPADGGHLYALLSPDGCLIDTVVDPRDLNASIKKEYANKDFYLEAKDKPAYIHQSNGNQQFTADIIVKNQCRACEVIGTAKVAFTYTKNGKWIKTELLSFTKS